MDKAEMADLNWILGLLQMRYLDKIDQTQVAVEGENEFVRNLITLQWHLLVAFVANSLQQEINS